MRFAGICLITKNVSKLATFYTKVLGVEADGDDTHVELITEGCGMTIFSDELCHLQYGRYSGRIILDSLPGSRIPR